MVCVRGVCFEYDRLVRFSLPVQTQTAKRMACVCVRWRAGQMEEVWWGVVVGVAGDWNCGCLGKSSVRVIGGRLRVVVR